jgi:hypothetical protein
MMPKSTTQNSKLKIRNSKPGTPNSELQTRNSKPGTPNSEPETGNSEPGTQNPKLKTRNCPCLNILTQNDLKQTQKTVNVYQA